MQTQNEPLKSPVLELLKRQVI